MALKLLRGPSNERWGVGPKIDGRLETDHKFCEIKHSSNLIHEYLLKSLHHNEE